MNNIKNGGIIVLNADDNFFNYHKKLAFKKIKDNFIWY